MTTPLDSEAQTPDDVHVFKDSAGHSFKLPGAAMSLRECALAWLLLSLLPAAIMPVIALFHGDGWAQALWVTAASALGMALITPIFIGLGAIAKKNGGLKVRVEPQGVVSYWSFGMDTTPQVAMADITDVETPADGPPRVLLVTDKQSLTIRTRTWDHARWLALTIQASRDLERDDHKQ